jgi:preprotein translocase subunit SecG
MPENKGAKKVLGMTEGLMALAFFVIAFVLGLLAQ